MDDTRGCRLSAFLFALMVIAATVSASGQGRGNPTSTPDPLDINRNIEERNRTNDRFESMRREPEIRAGSDEVRLKLKKDLEPLYRKPTKAEMALVAPGAEDIERHKIFLKLPKTGIVKLIPDAGCPDSIPVVSASSECLKYTMPGNGSSYSFRIENYRISRLSDITLLGNRFGTKGFMTQGVLVDIGDVPVESVSLSTSGAAYLGAFQPSTDVQQAAKADNDFLKGVQEGAFLYKRTVPVKENTTILLRSVAYKGRSMRSHETLTYDEFEFDRRSDITVAFRVVRRDGDGSVTLIWREIANNKPPTMAIPEK